MKIFANFKMKSVIQILMQIQGDNESQQMAKMIIDQQEICNRENLGAKGQLILALKMKRSQMREKKLVNTFTYKRTLKKERM